MSGETELRVRRMAAADLDRVIEIAESLKEAPHWPRVVYVEAMEPGGASRRIALVAEVAGAVAGFAVASVVKPQAELETIAVHAAGYRRGIGRKLLSALIGELQAEGVSEVLLEVRASNQRALLFYRALGWRETGRRPRYYADPEEDAVLMSLELE